MVAEAVQTSQLRMWIDDVCEARVQVAGGADLPDRSPRATQSTRHGQPIVFGETVRVRG